MRQGLTSNIDAIIEQVAQLECIKPYILCGGTALAITMAEMGVVLNVSKYGLNRSQRG